MISSSLWNFSQNTLACLWGFLWKQFTKATGSLAGFIKMSIIKCLLLKCLLWTRPCMIRWAPKDYKLYIHVGREIRCYIGYQWLKKSWTREKILDCEKFNSVDQIHKCWRIYSWMFTLVEFPPFAQQWYGREGGGSHLNIKLDVNSHLTIFMQNSPTKYFVRWSILI